MASLRDLLARRTDLSTFLVHLTRNYNGASAAGNLRQILTTGRIEARTPFGAAMSTLRRRNAPLDAASQRCVCFTETPLEHLHILLQPIEDLQRQCEFEPYGVALTKRMGRDAGVNPVWYTDITPGHNWLMQSVNALIDEALHDLDAKRDQGDRTSTFGGYPVAMLTPFIEQKGSGPGYRKEFVGAGMAVSRLPNIAPALHRDSARG